MRTVIFLCLIFCSFNVNAQNSDCPTPSKITSCSEISELQFSINDGVVEVTNCKENVKIERVLGKIHMKFFDESKTLKDQILIEPEKLCKNENVFEKWRFHKDPTDSSISVISCSSTVDPQVIIRNSRICLNTVIHAPAIISGSYLRNGAKIGELNKSLGRREEVVSISNTKLDGAAIIKGYVLIGDTLNESHISGSPQLIGRSSDINTEGQLSLQKVIITGSPIIKGRVSASNSEFHGTSEIEGQLEGLAFQNSKIYGLSNIKGEQLISSARIDGGTYHANVHGVGSLKVVPVIANRDYSGTNVFRNIYYVDRNVTDSTIEGKYAVENSGSASILRVHNNDFLKDVTLKGTGFYTCKIDPGVNSNGLPRGDVNIGINCHGQNTHLKTGTMIQGALNIGDFSTLENAIIDTGVSDVGIAASISGSVIKDSEIKGHPSITQSSVLNDSSVSGNAYVSSGSILSGATVNQNAIVKGSSVTDATVTCEYVMENRSVNGGYFCENPIELSNSSDERLAYQKDFVSFDKLNYKEFTRIHKRADLRFQRLKKFIKKL